MSPSFFPAFAHTDIIPFFENDRRETMSIRRLFPEEMQRRFLISLSFDEKIHYALNSGNGDQSALRECNPPLNDVEDIFVDCGAFHYRNMKIPRLTKGPIVTARSVLRSYQKRHIKRSNEINFHLCAPDHIITKDMDDEEANNRRRWTLDKSEKFLSLVTDENPGAIPVGVVHGRNLEERMSMLEQLIEIGFVNIAFGGLVPLSRDKFELLGQIAGITSKNPEFISSESPLHLAKKKGCRIHMLGLGSPEWYQWCLRLGIDSFDTAKLSQEGAANGLIWKLENKQETLLGAPVSANQLYSKIPIKKMGDVEWRDPEPRKASFDDDNSTDVLVQPDGIGKYFLHARCTSERCRHGPKSHVQDPRITGSADHNMARTILNAHIFQQLMDTMDSFHTLSVEDEAYSYWSEIPLE